MRHEYQSPMGPYKLNRDENCWLFQPQWIWRALSFDNVIYHIITERPVLVRDETDILKRLVYVR